MSIPPENKAQVTLIIFAWIGVFICVVADYFTTPQYNRRAISTLLALVIVTALAVAALGRVGAP